VLNPKEILIALEIHHNPLNIEPQHLPKFLLVQT